MAPGARIVGGRFRGRRLEVPASARPTEGRVREALMNIWAPRLEGARVLDLFAGSGAVGFEALGRGAESLTLVEKHPRSVSVLKKNAAALGLPSRSVGILRLELPKGASRLRGPFDLVFADPPYAFDAYPALLTSLVALLAEEGQVVVEHRTGPEPLSAPVSLEALGQRTYGDTALAFFRRRGDDEVR